MNYLNLFSISNLALITDWLEETGELCVDVYGPHSGHGGTGYFIRSPQDLKSLIAKQSWSELSVTVFRRKQFPLRGVASPKLLEKAMQQIPENYRFEIVNIWYYPESINFCGDGKSYAELRRDLIEVFGDVVGIGPELDFSTRSNKDEVFVVDYLRKNNFTISKNQDFYKPYAKNPEAYQWLEDFWSKPE